MQSTVKDPDGFFTPARLGTLGIAYNTKKSAAPKTGRTCWTPRFKDGFAIANPALSGTAMMSVAMLANTFGWEYIQKLKANGAKMGAGSGQVVDDTASGDFKASLAPDYIAIDKIEKGATMGFVYPPEMLVVPSPVAIFKGTPNLKAAQKFVDFLLSKEGQTIVAGEGTLPVRADVAVDTKYGLPPADEAVKRAMKVDYLKVMDEKEAIIQKFTADHAVARTRSRDDRKGRWGASSASPPRRIWEIELRGSAHGGRAFGESGGGPRDPSGLRGLHARRSGTGSVSRCSARRGAGRPWSCG